MKVTTWEAIKMEMEKANFKDDWNFQRTYADEKHGIGNFEHSMESYQAYCGAKYGFKIHAHYNVCQKCGNEIRNKYIVAFNPALNRCYVKYFVKNGKRLSW